MPQAVASLHEKNKKGGLEWGIWGLGSGRAVSRSQTILMMHIVKNFHWPRPLPFGMRMAQGLALPLPLALGLYDSDSRCDPASPLPPPLTIRQPLFNTALRL